MPESWTATLKSTHHSAGATPASECRPCGVFFCDIFQFLILFDFSSSKIQMPQHRLATDIKASRESTRVRRYLYAGHLHKLDQMPLHWNHIAAMTPKMCSISQSLAVLLNYIANQDKLNSKTRVAYESVHLVVYQNGGARRKKIQKSGNSWRGLADLTGEIITFQGFAFHANHFPAPGSSLLMALRIKLETHSNTNIPQCFGFVTSSALSS